jgi:predicted ester cyclase
MTNTDDLCAFIEGYGAVSNAHQWDEVQRYYAPDVRLNDVQTDPASIVAGLADLTAAFPDWQWGIRHMAFDGNLVMIHMRNTGTHKGPFAGIEPTGRKVTVQEFGYYRVIDDKITEIWVTIDFTSLTQQISKP